MNGAIRITEPGTVALFLGDMRRLHGLTQHAIAVQAGARQSQVSAWELGRVVPSVEPLIQLAQALGYDLAFIPREEA